MPPTDQTDTAPSRNTAATRRDTLAVVALAGALRLTAAGSSLRGGGAAWFFHRGLEMGWLADSLLAGRGLSGPFGYATPPSAIIAPGYPLLVAAVFRVLGSRTLLSAVALIGISLAANLGAVALIMRLARRLFNRPAALAAGLFWACSLPLLWMPTIFWETSLSACMLLGVVTLACEPQQARSRWFAPALGAGCAVAGLINPALLPSLLAVAVCAVLFSGPRATAAALGESAPRRRAARAAVLLLSFAVAFSPWVLRNAAVFHAFVPLRTTVGMELWMGNHAGADGFLDETLLPADNARERSLFLQGGELAYTAGKQTLALHWIADHPLAFAALSARRAGRFWAGTGSRGGSPVYMLHAMLTSVAGLAGLWLVWRRFGWRVGLPLALPLLLFPLPYFVTHAEFRYRLVIDPLLTVLAAGACLALCRRLAQPRATSSLTTGAMTSEGAACAHSG